VTATANSFYTFCLERNETVSAPTGTPATYAYTVDTEAMGGGYNWTASTTGLINSAGNDATPGNPDPINDNTAKLFYTFWTDQWAGTGITYSYGATGSGGQRGIDARDMQYAIWYMEGEISDAEWNQYLSGIGAGGQAEDMYDYANSVSWADLGQGSWATTGHLVRALNLWTTGSGSAVQSHLVVVPLPPAVLMGLALLSILGVSFFVRRRQRLSLN